MASQSFTECVFVEHPAGPAEGTEGTAKCTSVLAHEEPAVGLLKLHSSQQAGTHSARPFRRNVSKFKGTSVQREGVNASNHGEPRGIGI